MRTPLPPPVAAPGLQLTELRHAGLALDADWQWPDGASMQTFDDILGAILPPGPGRYIALETLELLRTDPAGEPTWWLVRQGGTLVCAVNGKPILPGERQRLEHGDGIEIGFTHVQVSLHAAAASDALVPAVERDIEGFDLAMLDVARLRASPHDIGLAPAVGADFSDLIAFHGEDLAPVHDAPARVPDSGKQSPLAELDPLEALHIRYLARLRDPLRRDEDPQWQSLARDRATEGARGHPLDQWMQGDPDARGVDDLLHPSSSIADVIHRLDALCITDVMAPEPFDNLMQLFAPEALRQGGQRPGPELPTLTRREHHSLSADSAVPLFPASGRSSDFHSQPQP